MNKNETIHERIASLVDYFGNGKNTVFASLINTSEANIRGYIKGIIPKHDVLEKIVKNLDVDADWLLTGRGTMLHLEQPLIEPSSMLQDSLGEASAYYKMYIEKDRRVEELLKENARLEERLHQLESEGSDFGDVAENVSTGSSLPHTNRATSAGARLNK